MFVKAALLGSLFLCILTLWTEEVVAGSSFLSPSDVHKPEERKQVKKPVANKMNRRGSEGILEELDSQCEEDTEEREFKFNIPFQLGITMTDLQYNQYGQLLQEALGDLLS
uniref:Ghrelin and obestatin prepropeptide n=2 Tax=Latimeria chalumnae TaxID=7897 RepID=H3B1Z6_LATCH